MIVWNDFCRDVESNRVSKFTEVTMQYSHYETVGDMADETLRYIKAYVNRKRTVDLDSEGGRPIKFWLLPFETEKNIWFNTLRQGCTANTTYDYRLYMEGEFMDPVKKLNEYEITDERLIVC